MPVAGADHQRRGHPGLNLRKLGGKNVMAIVYGLSGLFILFITLWSALEEDDFSFQATAALVAIPFILRVLMVK